MVESVEKLRPELQHRMFCECCFLYGGEIKLDYSGPQQPVRVRVTDYTELRWLLETGGVECQMGWCRPRIQLMECRNSDWARQPSETRNCSPVRYQHST